MGLETGEDPPPKSTDLDGWRRAVDDGRYREFRMEEIVATIQDLGMDTDKRVLNPLAKHFSDVLLRLLRKYVATSYPNRGWDIIERVHGQLIEAVLVPSSADGQGLRTAFAPRVKLRIIDAILAEKRAARDLREPAERGGESDPPDGTELPSPGGVTAERCYNPSSELAENIDVECALRQITDEQKRLAFRLFMDDIPYKSKRTHSIASSLGISEKTAREWIKELQTLLSTTREVQDLIELRRRTAP